MKLISIYIFSILFFASTRGLKSSRDMIQTRIHGGHYARRGSFSFSGYISYGGKRYCGASIIHQRWALTAAHCIRPKDNPQFTIAKVDDLQEGISYGIEEFYIHMDYRQIDEDDNNGLEYVVNDIGVVRLDTDIEFNDTIKPIELATDVNNNYENETVTVLGWGRGWFNMPDSKDLQYVEVHVLPMEDCQKVWTYASDHLCTDNRDRYGARGICYGDSGSPVVINNTQIGIVSTTDKYCKSLKPDLHTKVASFIPWIKGILKKHDDSLPSDSSQNQLVDKVVDKVLDKFPVKFPVKIPFLG